MLEEALKNYGTLGASGVLTLGILWLLRYMIMVTMPQQQDKFHVELKAEREVCQKNHERVIETLLCQGAETMKAIHDNRAAVVEMAHAAGIKRAIDEHEANLRRGHDERRT